MDNRKIINIIPYLILVMTISMFVGFWNSTTSKPMDYNGLINVLETEEVIDAQVSVGYNITTVAGYYQNEEGKRVKFSAKIPSTEAEVSRILGYLDESKLTIVDSEQSNAFIEIIKAFIPLIFFGALAMFMFRRVSSLQSKGTEATKSRARLEGNVKVRFSDVAGCTEEKEEMEELIEYLKSPKKFAKMGARIPKGILMVGPPGTGKTLLAKAVAGEADVPFYSVSGSDFTELYVGVGAGRVRDMFKKAKATSPCMIFIDEIDAVARQRGAGLGGGHDEKEQTLNQLLVEMDGISENTGIVIIAATNRPDVLDPALIRPGRIDRQITVGLPDRKGREEILAVHARNKPLSKDVDLVAIAKRTPGFSGADLENVLNEAAILAVREKSSVIGMSNLDEAIDRVMMGPAKKSRKYDAHSKKLVAYHEAGHAVVGIFLEDATTMVQKITIIPRGQAGGYNLMAEKEEKIMSTKKDLIARITSYMGGRVAEEIFFDDISAGAVGDIESSTKIARDMVTVYGMSDLGPIKYDSGSQNVFLGRDYNSPINVSGQIAYEIDQEVRKIIDHCHGKAHALISTHKEELIKIAEALLEYETITAEQIDLILEGKPLEEVMEDKIDQEAEIVDVSVDEENETETLTQDEMSDIAEIEEDNLEEK